MEQSYEKSIKLAVLLLVSECATLTATSCLQLKKNQLLKLQMLYTLAHYPDSSLPLSTIKTYYLKLSSLIYDFIALTFLAQHQEILFLRNETLLP